MAQELYELPEGWEWKTLSDTCEMYQPKTISSKKMVSNGKYPVFGANGIIGCYDEYNHENIELLITCRGATCGTVNLSVPFSWINGNAMVVRPLEHNIDLHFLKYVFEGGIKTSDAITGSAQPQITRTSLNPLTFPLPPFNEQKRIVAKLDELFTRIDTAITHLQQTLELSKALFASVLDEVFSQEQNKGKLVSLNQVATVARGKSKHRPRNDKTLFGGDYPFIQTGDVRNAEKYITTYSKAYSEKGLAQSKLWAKGTICLTIAANIGEVAMLGIDACFPDSVVGISSDSESNEYIYYFLTTLQRHLDSKATMAAQKNINLRILSDIEIPLPPLDEQKRIVAHLDALSERTHTLEVTTQEKINDLTALKASLLDSAFKGEL